MTVKKLREELAKYPDDMFVFVAERKTEFAFGLVNSVYTKEITFSESPDDEDFYGEPLPKDDVLVIDEE